MDMSLKLPEICNSPSSSIAGGVFGSSRSGSCSSIDCWLFLDSLACCLYESHHKLVAFHSLRNSHLPSGLKLVGCVPSSVVLADKSSGTADRRIVDLKIGNKSPSEDKDDESLDVACVMEAFSASSPTQSLLSITVLFASFSELELLSYSELLGSDGLGCISFRTLSRFAIVLASRSPWPASIPGSGRRGEFLDPFFLSHRERVCGTSESDPLTSDDARIWACRVREVLVGLGILIGHARPLNSVRPVPLKHRNQSTSKKKRFHIGVVVIADEAVPWSSLTLPQELGFATRHLRWCSVFLVCK